jgi:hypothetical protein
MLQQGRQVRLAIFNVYSWRDHFACLCTPLCYIHIPRILQIPSGKGKGWIGAQVLHNVAETNNRECDVILEIFAALTQAIRDDSSASGSESSGYPISELTVVLSLRVQRFRKTKVRACTDKYVILHGYIKPNYILVWTIYAFDYWGFPIAGNFRCRFILVRVAKIE